MAKPEHMTDRDQSHDPSEAAPQPGAQHSLLDDVVREVQGAIEAGDQAKVEALVLTLHYSLVAQLLQRVSPAERRALIDLVGTQLDPEAFVELDESVREEVIQQLGPRRAAAVVRELDTDDAVDLVQGLEEEVQKEVLEAVAAPERRVLEEGLSYPEDSAGRLMQRELVSVPAEWSVGQIIDHLRQAEDLPDDFYDLFVVDQAQKPIGTVPLSRVLRTRRPVAVAEIMDKRDELVTVPVAMDQEQVADLFRRHDLTSAPVVDEAGRLVGVVTIDDVVDVIDEEYEEDLMRMAGVGETDLYRAVLATTKSRFSWLAINLGTAIVASTVIGAFADTIEELVALAVLMPIVASMGGNAGTQTLAVMVRALATKELSPTNALRAIGKEVLVGGINGVLFAALGAVAAGLWFDSLGIGLVLGAAMIVNLLAAGIAGSTIPLGLSLMRIDPAVASGVFLTTVTDVVGFFAFLGLAAWLLL